MKKKKNLWKRDFNSFTQAENLELTETSMQYRINDATKRHKEYFRHSHTEQWRITANIQSP